MNHIVSVVTEQIHEMKSVQINPVEELNESHDTKIDTNSVLKNRLLQLVAVMQQGGQFKGFNRKIQIRTLKWNDPNADDSVCDDGSSEIMAPSATPSPLFRPRDMPTDFSPLLLNSGLDGTSHFELRQGVERVLLCVILTIVH